MLYWKERKKHNIVQRHECSCFYKYTRSSFYIWWLNCILVSAYWHYSNIKEIGKWHVVVFIYFMHVTKMWFILWYKLCRTVRDWQGLVTHSRTILPRALCFSLRMEMLNNLSGNQLFWYPPYSKLFPNPQMHPTTSNSSQGISLLLILMTIIWSVHSFPFPNPLCSSFFFH